MKTYPGFLGYAGRAVGPASVTMVITSVGMEQPIRSLRAAFNALISSTEPAKAEAVLKRSLLLLLSGDHHDDALSRPLAPRSPSISNADGAAWAILKVQIRTYLDLHGMTLGDLSQASNIPRGTLEKVLSPKGSTPGRLIADTLSAWLATRAPAMDIAPEAPAPAANGHAVVERRPHAGRLTQQQIEALTNHLSLMDERAVRKSLGLTLEVLDQAVAGAEVPAEVVERIATFLNGEDNGAC